MLKKEIEFKIAEIDDALVKQRVSRKAVSELKKAEAFASDLDFLESPIDAIPTNVNFDSGKIESFEELGESDSNKILIKGIAIQEGTYKGIHYSADVLKKSAESLVGKPLRVDHQKGVKDIVGKVLKAWYDSGLKAIKYVAEVFDKSVARLVKEGLVNDVSIGAWVDTVASKGKEEANSVDFKELSLLEDGAVKTANAEIVPTEGQ